MDMFYKIRIYKLIESRLKKISFTLSWKFNYHLFKKKWVTHPWQDIKLRPLFSTFKDLGKGVPTEWIDSSKTNVELIEEIEKINEILDLEVSFE